MRNSSRKRSTVTSLMTSSWCRSNKFVNTSWLPIISSLVNIRCKLLKLLYLQVRNILNSIWNWSAVTSMMTSSWHHSIELIKTTWVSIISSLVNIRCKLIKLLYSQVRNILNPSRNWSAVPSLMMSSWRH